jgi:hypothetical protein
MRITDAIAAHFASHYDAHIASAGAAGVSMFSGIEDRFINAGFSVGVGLTLFVLTTLIKRLATGKWFS